MIQQNLFSQLGGDNAMLTVGNGFFAEIVQETYELSRFAPRILGCLNRDIDLNARQAKIFRVLDEVFWRFEILECLSPLTEELNLEGFDSVLPEKVKLHQGRPRGIDAEILLVLCALNSIQSLTSSMGYENLADSLTFRTFLEAKGFSMPQRSTVNKYLSLVSEETMEMIQIAQMEQVLNLGMDDLKRLVLDSTAVPANTAWPVESSLIHRCLNCVVGLLEKQRSFLNLKEHTKVADNRLKDIQRIDKTICLLPSSPGAKKERKRLYRKLLKIAKKLHAQLSDIVTTRKAEVSSCRMKPSFHLRIRKMTELMELNLEDCARTIENTKRRVLHGEKVPADQKCYSLSDRDAYMIKKGERIPVVGYKPQIGRSAGGFIIGFEVEHGNPADALRLIPMVKQCESTTGITLTEISTDDGYTSANNLAELSRDGAVIVSFSGAKGRKVLGEELWNSQKYKDLRQSRPAVESTIFTIKHKFRLQSFCRRGLLGVKFELACAVFAFNLWRTAYMRRCNTNSTAKAA